MITKEWLDYIARLEDGLRFKANCPCCNENIKCDDDCTFAEDDPNGKEEMEYIRELLAERPKE